jgi:hypothetical protein
MVLADDLPVGCYRILLRPEAPALDLRSVGICCNITPLSEMLIAECSYRTHLLQLLVAGEIAG